MSLINSILTTSFSKLSCFFYHKAETNMTDRAECHLMKRLSTKDMSLALCSLPTFITCLWIETSRGCWPPLLFCCLFVLPQLNPKNLKNPLVMAKIDQLLFNGCSFFFFSQYWLPLCLFVWEHKHPPCVYVNKAFHLWATLTETERKYNNLM